MCKVDIKVEYDSTHVDPLYPNWFLVLYILTFIFNYSNWIQASDLLYSICEENGSIIQRTFVIVQIDPSLFSYNGESETLTDPFNLNTDLNTFISIYHFTTSVSNDNFFTFSDSIKAINSYDLLFYFHILVK